MIVLFTATVVLVLAAALGQAVLRLIGLTGWSWTAPATGLAALLALGALGAQLPGRAATLAVLLALLGAASGWWCWRTAEHRPDWQGIVVGLPVAGATSIIFANAERTGTIGVAFNNDMAAHLLIADALRSSAVARVTPVQRGYPIGPHGLTAALAELLGARTDLVFAGLTVALPILLAWTALSASRRVNSLPGMMLLAVLTGMPFLVASYTAQGAFKEPALTVLVLASILWLENAEGRMLLRWVPVAVLAAGIVSTYSVSGLVWPLGTSVIAIGVSVLRRWRKGGWRSLPDREDVTSVFLATVVAMLAILPQADRVHDFLTYKGGFRIRKDDIGNLAGPLSPREALGAWSVADFRFLEPGSNWTAVRTGIAVTLVLLGFCWCLARRRWVLLGGVVVTGGVYILSRETQSPYVAAKALVVFSPVLLLMAGLPLAHWMSHGQSPPRRALASAGALALAVPIVLSSAQAYGNGHVAADAHLVELRALRASLHGHSTLFLGNDDFIRWELTGVPVVAPVVGSPQFQNPTGKQWVYGKAVDIDSVPTDVINSIEFLVMPSDPAASALPPQFELIRSTRSYRVWRRMAPVAPRRILPEGGEPGAVLDCSTVAGRALAAGGGTAVIRPSPIAVPGGALIPNGVVTFSLSLPPGDWDLAMDYYAAQPLDLTGGGLAVRMPANQDRPGTRWLIGQVSSDGRPISLQVRLESSGVHGGYDAGTVTTLVAVPTVAPVMVPLANACGRYVDSYTTP